MTREIGRDEDAVALQGKLFERKPLTSPMYYGKHLLVGTIGEAFTRAMGHENTLSFTNLTGYLAQKCDDLTGLGSWFKSGGAEAAANETVKAATEETIKETEEQLIEEITKGMGLPPETAATWAWSDYIPESIQSAYNGASELGSRSWDSVSSYLGNNADWLLETGGIALTSAFINHFATKKIKNVYVRNITSVFGGVVSVWTAKTVLSYFGYSNPAELSKMVDIGARLFVSHFLCTKMAPRIQKMMNPLCAPYFFETKSVKVKAS